LLREGDLRVQVFSVANLAAQVVVGEQKRDAGANEPKPRMG